jgi:hypothetical protein
MDSFEILVEDMSLPLSPLLVLPLYGDGIYMNTHTLYRIYIFNHQVK